jgi:hypothetical protein
MVFKKNRAAKIDCKPTSKHWRVWIYSLHNNTDMLLYLYQVGTEQTTQLGDI